MTSHIFKKIIFFSAVIILWQAVASFDLWPDQIFPSPYEIAEDLAYGVLDGSLFYGIGTSMAGLKRFSWQYWAGLLGDLQFPHEP